MRSAEENKLEKDLKRWFSKLQKRVQKLIETHYEDELFFLHVNKVYDIVEEMKPEYQDILLKHSLTRFYNARETTTTLYTIQQKKVSTKASLYEPQIIRQENIGLFRTNPQLEDNLRYNTFNASDKTLARVTDNITNNLADSYHEGLGIQDASRKINKEFNQLKGWESKRIARTEINSAQNEGAFSDYDELGVEYHMWWTGQDNRVRDTHTPLHGHIVKVGNTFSNGLLYPGDKSGPISEWINCRCTTIPYIIPLGKMAPPGLTEFTEDQLIDIPGFEMPQYDNVEKLLQEMETTPQDNVDNIMFNLNKRTDDWDIYRLGEKDRENYLRYRKNYEILKDALENKNYSRLKDMEHLNAYSKYTPESFIKNIETVKMDLEDLKFDIKIMEKTIRNKNIQVDPKLRGIKWNSPELKDCYNLVDGEYVNFNTAEKFEKYYFKDEGLTILKSKDFDNKVMMRVYEDYKELPPALKKSKEIVLSNQSPRAVNFGGDTLHMAYVTEGKGNRIVNFNHKIPNSPLNRRIKNTIIHESTHLLEKDSNYFISNSKEYVKAFKKDQKRLRDLGKSLDETYVSSYAKNFTESALKPGNLKYDITKHRAYSEDFAESMKSYLSDKKTFKERFPEKAKVLKKVLKEEFKKNSTIPYKDWLNKEGNRYDITKFQKKKVRELEIKGRGSELTKAERKKLDYLHERQEFSYLHQQKIRDGKYFDKVRYDKLYKKFEKELKLPNKKEIIKEEKFLEGKIRFTQKEQEDYLKLKARVESGEKLKFMEKSRFKTYEKQTEFNKYYSKYGDKLPDDYIESKEYKALYSHLHQKGKLTQDVDKFFNIKKLEPQPIKNKKQPKKEVIVEKHEGSKYKDYTHVRDDIDDHMTNIQSKTKYQNHHIKATKDYGGPDWYDCMNDLCYGNKSLETNLKKNNLTKAQVKRKIKDLDETIHLSSGLDDNYTLWKGGDSRGIDLTSGAKNKWDAFSSTSFDRDVAEEYYESAIERLEKQEIGDEVPILFKIRAKKGTKGVYMDEKMRAANGEYEFLLGRNQEFKVIRYNPDSHICEIELL